MSHGMYTHEELTVSIESEFSLDSGGNAYHEKYMQRVRRALVDTGIWDEAEEKLIPGSNNRKCKYFSEADKRAILAEDSFYNYVRKHSTDHIIKYSDKYETVKNHLEEEVEDRYNELYEKNENRDNDYYSDILSSEEVHLRKLFYMIQAIYNNQLFPETKQKGKRDTGDTQGSTSEEMITSILQMDDDEYYENIFKPDVLDPESREYVRALDIDTKKELRNRKMYLMIESIFNLYFTQFNDELFLYDCERGIMFGDPTMALDDDLVQIADAKKRLNHPEGTYFTRRKD